MYCFSPLSTCFPLVLYVAQNIVSNKQQMQDCFERLKQMYQPDQCRTRQITIKVKVTCWIGATVVTGLQEVWTVYFSRYP